MELLLKRIYSGESYTTGMLFIRNRETKEYELFCDTIADSRRSLATLLRLMAKRPTGEAVRLTIEDAPACEDVPDCEAEAEDTTSDC